MTDKRIIWLRDPATRQRALDAIKEAPDGWKVTVQPPTRSLDQNAKFHSICADLTHMRAEWAGKPRCIDEWKALLVSGHAVATKQGGEIVPGIEGELVSIRESTATMSKARSSSLIEYAEAFRALLLS